MRQLLPYQPDEIDPEAIYDDLVLPAGRAGRPYVAINMVATVDGKAAVDGRAQGIGSRIDRLAMRKLRAVVDAVLIGAGTLRQEPTDPTVPPALSARRVAQGLSPQPLGVLVTGTANLPLGRRFFTLESFQPVVFVGQRADPQRLAALEATRARIYYAEGDEPDLRQVLETLYAELGVRRLLVEGGPTINGSLIGASLADELFLTLAPRIVGGTGLSIVAGAALPPAELARLRLVSLIEHASELFLRYRFV